MRPFRRAMRLASHFLYIRMRRASETRSCRRETTWQPNSAKSAGNLILDDRVIMMTKGNAPKPATFRTAPKIAPPLLLRERTRRHRADDGVHVKQFTEIIVAESCSILRPKCRGSTHKFNVMPLSSGSSAVLLFLLCADVLGQTTRQTAAVCPNLNNTSASAAYRGQTANTLPGNVSKVNLRPAGAGSTLSFATSLVPE